MNARSVNSDIVTLRMTHCRAEQAAQSAQYHLATQHYRTCLEVSEIRQDTRATQFFALRLADCYEQMGFHEKSANLRALAEDYSQQPE